MLLCQVLQANAWEAQQEGAAAIAHGELVWSPDGRLLPPGNPALDPRRR